MGPHHACACGLKYFKHPKWPKSWTIAEFGSEYTSTCSGMVHNTPSRILGWYMVSQLKIWDGTRYTSIDGLSHSIPVPDGMSYGIPVHNGMSHNTMQYALSRLRFLDSAICEPIVHPWGRY